jgi:hypothetical protein
MRERAAMGIAIGELYPQVQQATGSLVGTPMRALSTFRNAFTRCQASLIGTEPSQ